MRYSIQNCLLLLALLATMTLQSRAAISPDDYEEEAQHPHLRRMREFEALDEELDTSFWHNKAQSILVNKLEMYKKLNENRAKNIIFFLGDGMSVHTIAATRAFMGDSNKQVYFETFPYVGLAKTYAVDERTPDSASTATAYLSGVKGNYGTIGVNAQVSRRDCLAATDNSTHTESIAKWAQDAGKWAGLVTNTRVTHASPAGVYAHVADRDWENDAEVTADGCSADLNVDIARQLVEQPVGSNLRVILGGGRAQFRDATMTDEDGYLGLRSDGRDLIDDWKKDKQDLGVSAHYVWSREGLNDIDLSKTDYLLGLFNPSHCPYNGDRIRDNLEATSPSLSEMTKTAIELLSRSDQGYFLFVEGGRIDMAHHDTKAQKALEETVEFANAIELARSLTDEKDTLIIVTSDHSHTMTINGYPYRRQNVLTVAPNLALDELPFTILSYANGPGHAKTFNSQTGRVDLSQVDTTGPEFQFQSTVPLSSETHGGEDVGVFASGPFEHLFAGNYEQSSIPAFLSYAANIGPFAQKNMPIER